jgi:putative transferase (TIGR04331 family)
MSRHLITTAIERTWPVGQPALMLGEWCRRFSRRDAWISLDVEIVPYHWDDRSKLQADYKYIAKIYEELLSELAERLNSIHSVAYSIKYWRILVGPWLGHFVQVLFDRWAVLSSAIENFDASEVTVQNIDPILMVPADMNEFIAMYVGDSWNEAVIAQLVLKYTTVPVRHVDAGVSLSVGGRADNNFGIRHYLKLAFDGLSRYCLPLITRKDEGFFASTYMPRRSEWWLQLQFWQVPKTRRVVNTPKVAVDSNLRRWTLGDGVFLRRCDFRRIVRDLIPLHIPTVYLEGYAQLRNICRLQPWPAVPRFIFTSNAFSSDDVFKVWAAEKVENGVPLIIGQHGGNYGMALWSYMEDHQIAIADKFISWGWSRESEPKVEPVCNLKVIGLSQAWDPNGRALMTELTLPRYSYQMFSSPVGCQWLKYFDDQCRFVRALPEHVRLQLTVRLYSDYGWDEAERWRAQFPDIHLDSGIVPLSSLIAHSRISISTYNATTFLESLALNVPTIVFWDPIYWELNDDATRGIQVLKDAGIFHESPESAAAQLAQIWDDVRGWWSGALVQHARKEFCSKYSRTSKDSLKHLESALRSSIRTKERHTNHV